MSVEGVLHVKVVGVLQGDPLSETDRSSELRRELIDSHVPQHSVLSQLPSSQTTTTRMKFVGNFEAFGTFIQNLLMLIHVLVGTAFI